MKYLLILLVFTSFPGVTQIWPDHPPLSPYPNAYVRLHPYIDGVRMVELDYENSWRDMTHHMDMAQPRALSWCVDNPLIAPNAYIFVDSAGKVIKYYNLDMLPNVMPEYSFEMNPKETEKEVSFQGYNPTLKGYYIVYDSIRRPDKVLRFGDSFSVGKRGLIDSLGNLVIPILYDQLQAYGDCFMVSRGGQIGLLNTQNTFVVPLENDEVKELRTYVLFKQDGRITAVYDINENRLRQVPECTDLRVGRAYSEGYFIAINHGDVALLDSNFKNLTGFDYQYLEGDFRYDRMAVVRNNKWGFIDRTGKEVIPCKYGDAMSFLRSPYEHTRVFDSDYRCISTAGVFLDSCPYVNIQLQSMHHLQLNGDFAVRRYDKCGAKTHLHDFKAPVIYDHISLMLNVTDNLKNIVSPIPDVYRVSKYKTYGLVKRGSGKTLLPFDYDGIGDFNAFGFATIQKKSRFGLINRRYEIVLPCEYDYLRTAVVHGKMIASRNGKYGALDSNLRTVIPFEYEQLQIHPITGLSSARRNGFWGVINADLEVLLPFEFDYVVGVLKDRAVVSLNEKHGVVDFKGHTIIPFNYDMLLYSIENPVIARQFDAYILLKQNGKRINSASYEFIDRNWDEKSRTVAKINGKYGLINKRGKVLVPFIYDSYYGYQRKWGYRFVLNHNDVWIE